MFRSWNPDQPEITDLIVRHDPVTLERLVVRKQDVLEVFASFQNRQALRAVEALPARDGILEPREIDRLLVAVHWEMQRLSEEFYHGSRVFEVIRAVIDAIRAGGFSSPLRVVDVGCGIGYNIRWLAAHTPLALQNVELTGVDLNSALINEANRLSAAENLPCRFLHGDAFSSAYSGHIYFSTGVIHHFRGEALREFLGRHQRPGTLAFLHFDFQPWVLAPYGSWFFHFLRMRTRVARHDGVLSAARAHTAETLLQVARTAAPQFVSGIYGAKIWNTPAPRVFHTLIGIRKPPLLSLRLHFGRLASRLGELR
jgi:ubiquinone/menaquinone biosynthesis C-methylase UbiE